jgi:hypothetical protein
VFNHLVKDLPLVCELFKLLDVLLSKVRPTEPITRTADPRYQYTERYGRYTAKYRTNSKKNQDETPIQSVWSGRDERYTGRLEWLAGVIGYFTGAFFAAHLC